jgi:hypothetical protein
MSLFDRFLNDLDRLVRRYRSGAVGLRLRMAGPFRKRPHQPRTEEPVVADIILTDEQEGDFRIDPRDKHNKPAKIFGTPQWSTSDPTVLDVTPSPDGMSCTVGANGQNLGRAQVSVKIQRSEDPADVLVGAQGFEVVAGEVAVVNIMGGTIRPRPAPAPDPNAPPVPVNP